MLAKENAGEAANLVRTVGFCRSGGELRGRRVALQDLPNFVPVAAVALFAGYFFRSGVLAVRPTLGDGDQ